MSRLAQGNIIEKVDKRSWGIQLLLDETTKTSPRTVEIVQMPSAPSGGWTFYMIKRAWLVPLLGGNVRTIHIKPERGSPGIARLDMEALSDDEALVVEMVDGSVRIYLRALDASMLEVAVDALLEGGDKSTFIDSFGTAAGIADAIVRARVKSLRLRQTAAVQGRTKASRRAMRGTH